MPTDRVLVEIVTAANMAGVEQAKAGFLGMNASTIGLGLALGALILIGKSAIENTEKQTKAHLDLAQAAKANSQNVGALQGWYDSFSETNKRYISDQYELEGAYANIIRTGVSVGEGQRQLNDVLDLATLKSEDYGTAQQMITLALAGNARGLKVLGITTDEYNAIMKDKTLTTEQKHAELLALIETKTKDGRKAQTDLTQSTQAINKDWQDMSTKIGPPLLSLITFVVDEVDKLVKALSDLGQNKDWNKWISAGLGHVQDALLGAVDLVKLLGREGGRIGTLFSDLTHGNWGSIPGDVAALQKMDTPGIVAGPPGSRQIVAALGGEHFGGSQSIGRGMAGYGTYVDLRGAFLLEGPMIDRLANLIAQRSAYASGR